MPLGWIIFFIVLAVIALIVISYMFRDSFFLFEGVCVLCDSIGNSMGDGDFGGD